MLVRKISSQLHSLLHHHSYSIVIRYQKKRSVFDKTSYNPQWIPRQTPYSKHRKPRQQQWDDPNVIYPILIPPMHPPCKPKAFLKTIEEQQRIKSSRKKQFLLQDIRSGDIVEITYQETFQVQKTVTHRCFVLAFKRRRSLTAMLQVAIRFGGMSIRAQYLIHSPKVVNIKLVAKGSGNFRNNLKTRWRRMSKNQLLNPRLKRGVMKARGTSNRRKKSQTQIKSQSTTPKTISFIKFDKLQSDSVKKIN